MLRLPAPPPRAWASALSWLLVASALAGEAGPSDDPLEAGLTCHESLDFACAVDLLGAALERENLPPERARLGLLRLAESHLALGQREAAVAALGRLLEREPDFHGAPEDGPKLRAALEEARRRSPSPGTRDEPWGLHLGLSAGAELLVGADADSLQAGPLVELRLGVELNELARVSVSLRWASHDLKAAGGEALHLVAGCLGVGLGGELGPVGLEGMIGVGASRFGILEVEGKTGLWLPLRLAADLRLLPWLRLGLGLSPAWTVLPSEGRSSFTLGLAGEITFVL